VKILDSNAEIVTLNEKLEEKDQEITKENIKIFEMNHHLSRKDNSIHTLKTENSEIN
jgi:hypothetical protein